MFSAKSVKLFTYSRCQKSFHYPFSQQLVHLNVLKQFIEHLEGLFDVVLIDQFVVKENLNPFTFFVIERSLPHDRLLSFNL